jgi:hypothetical protein
MALLLAVHFFSSSHKLIEQKKKKGKNIQQAGFPDGHPL